LTALILKSNTWYLIEELPEEPKRDYINHDISTREFIFKINYDKYRASLKAAISNAVRVQNQEVVASLRLHSIHYASYTSDALKKRGHVPGKCNCTEPDKVYPVEVRYEIVEACTHDSCPVDAGCEHCKEPVRFARLLPSKEEVRDLWTEVEEKVKQSQWFALDVVRYLKENYNITRKQQ
jgi:hypothetical protein